MQQDVSSSCVSILACLLHSKPLCSSNTPVARLRMQMAQLEDEQQQEDSDSELSGTLFGAKEGVKLANGQQVAAMAAKTGARNAANSRTRSTQFQKASPSRFAKKLEETRHRVGLQAASRQRYSAIVSSFPSQPEPAVEELSEAEVARCGWGGDKAGLGGRGIVLRLSVCLGPSLLLEGLGRRSDVPVRAWCPCACIPHALNWLLQAAGGHQGGHAALLAWL